ncbi:MAG: VPLPA-CTERM sorting domain-containing protein [Candidatus Thiodiazotropha sp.]|jgi:uncharacterized protein YkwD
MIKIENDNRSIGCKLIPSLLLGVSLVTPLGAGAATWAAQELAVFDMVNQQRGFYGLNSVQMDNRLHDSAVGYSQSMADNNFFDHTALAGPNAGSTPGDRISAAGYQFTSWGENIAAGQGRSSPSFSAESDPIAAAHDVMYGTEFFSEINDFFAANSANHVSATGWDDLGDGLTGDDWNDWYKSRGGHGGWMGSEGHRNTILNGSYNDLGVGYVWDASDEGGVLLNGGETVDVPLHSYWTQHFASGDSVVSIASPSPSLTEAPSSHAPSPSPVPLPAAFWLLGSGLMSLVLVGRKRSGAVASV